MFKRKNKYNTYKVFYKMNDKLRLNSNEIKSSQRACYRDISNTDDNYVHHIMTPEILEIEYLKNIKLIVKELKKCLGKDIVMYKVNDSYVIRILKQEMYNHNMLISNFIRNIYYKNGEHIDYDYYYAGLAGDTPDICPSEDGLYRLLFYQNKATERKKNITYGRGDHNILFLNCKLYTYNEVKKIYKNHNFSTRDLLKQG